MKRRTGAFVAQGDDGRNYTIHEYTDIETIESQDEPATTRILKELFTSTGSRVHYKEKGVYEIEASGVILRSSDPDAP
jgi:hypothetical protein